MSVYSTKSNNEPEYIKNPLDIVIESVENDLKMFDSVITLDFLEAYNEAGYNVVTEAEEEQTKTGGIKAIAQKIFDAFMNAVEAFIRFMDNWLTKVKNMLTNDKALYNKYKVAFETNGEGYKTKWIPGNPFYSQESAIIAYRDKLDGEYKDAVNKINKTTTSEDANAALKEYRDSLDKHDPVKDADAFLFTGEEEKDYALTTKDVANIENIMKDSKPVINFADKFKDKTKKDYNVNAKANKENLLKAAEGGKDAIAKANAINSATNEYIRVNMKFANAIINALNRQIAQYRRAFIGASKAKKEDTTGEPSAETKTECAMLEMASDLYVESALMMD